MRNKTIWFSIFMVCLGSLILTGCREKAGNSITSTGTIEMTEINISTRIGGTLDKILVDEGQPIKAGQLLAELDHQELNDQLASAQAAFDAAVIKERQSQVNLKLTQDQYQAQTKQALANKEAAKQQTKMTLNGARRQELEMAKSAVNQAKAQLDLANKTYRRQLNLFNEGLIAQAQLDQTLSQKLVAEAQYKSASDNLSLVEAGARDESIAIAKSQEKSATAGVDLAQSNERLVQLRREEIALASSSIKQAQASIALLKTQLSHCFIKAPTEGVISTKLTELGENVSVGTNILTMLDMKRPWLKVYLPLTEVERVRVGDRVKVKIDAFPNRTFYGRVSQIASEAEFTPRNFQTKDERIKQVFAVKIRLDNSSRLLKAGMPADAEITVNGANH
ncbi:MAG TPA: efflux RND transporter periplasmic adaptor subunit [Bacillota bacterium]|nr:efflux RND transporter periplasmic adaptor subunit [Bacillota bacterium]